MQLTAMLYAQITDANGLRSIENAFARNSSASYHLGLDRKIKKKLFAVDATVISLNKNDYGWADFREAKAGIKVHVQYSVDDKSPTYFFITNAKEHENNTMEDMDLKKGDRVSMDRGYFNASEFHRMTCAGIEFVTRMKSGVLYKVVRENAVTDKNIGFDRIIQFTGREASKECPDELRLIESTDPETGKTIVILTNMKGHAAKFVAGLYKKRWQVELFFKAVKQNLHIKRFYGKSENAVFIQVYIAMIAYVLFMLLKKKSEMTGLCFTHFIDMMKVNLFTRTDLLLWLCGKIQKPSFPDLDRLQAYLPFA